jgi:adenosine deaminase
VMEEISKQCVLDAHGEGIVALELRFAPNSMARLKNLDPGKVIEAVVRGVQAGERETGVVVSLVVIIPRYLSPEIGMQIEALARDHVNTGAAASPKSTKTTKSPKRPSFGRVIGLDLAADEARFPAPPFAPCFQAAEKDGLRRTVHAGEALGPESVIAALDLCRAERIGHGVRSFADPALVERLVKNGTVLEMCPTSNVQTGAVASLAEHPLKRFLALGGKATINTDDPGVCATDLNREFLIAARDLGLSLADLETCVLNAADAIFLPPAVRGAVRAAIHRRMDALNRELSNSK